jgi:hypothetical protein
MKRREMLKISGGLVAGLASGQVKIKAAQITTPILDSAPASSGQPRNEVQFSRSIPVRHEVDVFIAGGGPAGIAAALGARSQNASVYLAEAHTCLGGMGTAARVPVFAAFSDGVNFLPGGVGRRIYDRWCQAARYPGLGIEAEALMRIYDDLLEESKAQFTLCTRLIGVESASGRVTHVVCQGKSGLFAVRAKAYIDCTGDGDLAAWAGAPFEKGDPDGLCQGATLCSLWSGVDWKKVNAAHVDQSSRLEDAYRHKVFNYLDTHLPGMFPLGEHLAGGNCGHLYGVDGTDERSLTTALVAGRRQMPAFERYYKEYLKGGFENIDLLATGSLLGIRETRRITGDYELVADDFLKQSVFDDEIGRFNNWWDIHASRPGQYENEFSRKYGKPFFKYKPGESYGIPYRILVPRGLDNVWVAGRCVSADRAMLGSIRVMPGCFITGQAAGVAAALSAERNASSRDVNVKDLQHRLKALGAFLPNYQS